MKRTRRKSREEVEKKHKDGVTVCDKRRGVKLEENQQLCLLQHVLVSTYTPSLRTGGEVSVSGRRSLRINYSWAHRP